MPVLCVLMWASCGSNGNGNDPLPLSGNWQAALTLTTPPGNKVKGLSGFLIQSGNTLTGNMLLAGQTQCTGVGAASGQLSGSAISLSVSETGQTVNLTGMVGGGSSMGGNYSILASPCGASQIGTWTANLVQPLTGNFQGTFTSTQTSGLVYHFSGTISQAANTGSSSANLSGSMTSTDSPCFSSASVSGLISGTAVVFNLLSSEGIALGRLNGTTTTTAGSITGPYEILNSQSVQLGGCTDLGNAAISLTP